MYCENCGNKLNDNGVCEKCQKKGNGINKKLLIGGGFAIVVAAILGIVLVATRPQKFELVTFIDELEIDGFNQYAEINTSELINEFSVRKALLPLLNTDSLEDEFENASDEEMEEIIAEGLAVSLEADAAIQEIVDSIQLSLWKNDEPVDSLTELSNDDSIRIAISSTDSVNEYFNIELVQGEIEFIISGLEEGIVLDVFSDKFVEIKPGGIDGEGFLSVLLKDDATVPDTISFHVENNHSLVNGDEITITANYDKEYFLAMGYCLKTEEITYTVSGLGQYLQSADDVPDDFKKAIVGAATAEMNDWFNLALMIADSNVTFETMYFATVNPNVQEEDADKLHKNALFVVGRYKQSGEEKYCYIVIPRLVLLADGTLEASGYSNITDLYLDITDWGYDATELLEVMSEDNCYDLTEVKM